MGFAKRESLKFTAKKKKSKNQWDELEKGVIDDES
jgi:hypothetical protein